MEYTPEATSWKDFPFIPALCILKAAIIAALLKAKFFSLSSVSG